MKKQSLLFFFAISLFFVGCTIEKRHYNSGYHVEWLSQKGKMKKAEPTAQPEKENEQLMAMEQEVKQKANEINTEALVVMENVVAPSGSEITSVAPNKPETENVVSKTARKDSKRNDIGVERNQSVSVEKGFAAQSSLSDIDSSNSSPLSDVPVIVLVILAIILPPLAVFLHSGIGTPFWISLILTLLFWVPGVIYALLVVLDVI